MLFLSVILTFLTLGALWFAAVLNEHDMHPMRRLAELMKRPALEVALVALVAVGLIHHGATKGTNGVNGVGGGLDGGTNGVQNVGGFLTGLTGLTGFWDGGGQGLPTLPTTNYQLSTTNLDWLAFGGYVDWFRVEDGAWCFRFGSNLVERVTVFSCGEIASAPFGASNRISLLGLPLSIVPAANWHLLNPQRSLFWHTATPSNTLLLTWENALVRRDTNLPVTVQVELFPDGAAALRYDFTTMCDVSVLSNAEARIVRDGLAEAVPLMTGAVTLVEFAAPTIAGTNLIDEVQARIAGGNTNAYYCADVVVAKGPSKIRVEPMADETNRGLLGAYEIVALPGETNRLPLLIGPKYTVSAEVAFESFELVPPPFVPLADDTGTVERLEFGEAFSATNVTDRLVEVQWPVMYWLEAINATQGAITYALRITPDWLDGTLTWHGIDDTNSPPMRGAPPMRSGNGDSCTCGCITRDGDDIIHSLSCTCTFCYAGGDLVYEAYREDINCDVKDTSGGGGGNSPDGGGNNPPDPDGPSVSVCFDKNVVIFEDEYEDSPGVFVDRRSTTTKLTISAYGGENGALISLSIPSALELYSSDGNMPTYVMPGGTVEWEAYYKGTAPSDGVGGTTVSASIIDYLTFESESASDSLTVVEVKVKAQNTAPQNNCWQRHSYGVCERVVLQHVPDSVNVTWNSAGGIITGIDQLPYSMLKCPAVGGSESLTASLSGVDYPLILNIIEPQIIVVTNITAITTNLPVGIAGHVGMRMEQYVSPFTVSFSRIAIEEVPCEEGFHSGYYSNPSMSNLWSHTYSNGAGLWHAVNMMNRITIDRATCGACPQPWSQGTLIWNIPFGWHPLTANGNVPVLGTLPTKEFATDVRSTITINSTGFVILMKLGHWVSRDIYNEVALDGVVIMEGEQ